MHFHLDWPVQLWIELVWLHLVGTTHTPSPCGQLEWCLDAVGSLFDCPFPLGIGSVWFDLVRFTCALTPLVNLTGPWGQCLVSLIGRFWMGVRFAEEELENHVCFF